MNIKLFVCTILGLSAQAFATPSEYMVDVSEPQVLEQLDKENIYSFATVLGAGAQEQSFKSSRATDASFSRLRVLRLSDLSSSSSPASAWYNVIRQTIKADVDEFTANSGVNSTYSVSLLTDATKERPRHFDYFWLNSRSAAFKLISVVNRIDRKDFDPSSCGELRFIYRLGYSSMSAAGTEQFSMMPLFLNVVYKYNGGQCSALANTWKLNRLNYDLNGFAQALLAGPLNRGNVSLKQIELNMQMARFSSGDRIDFGGSAVYLLRIFAPNSLGALESVALENTPDVTAILHDPALRADLLSQITNQQNLAKIDEGTFQLVNTNGRLLAKKALSFSTTGRARLGNKPFSFLFLNSPSANSASRFSAQDQAQFSRLSFSETDLIKGSLGLIERLDSNSCMGCHQSNGTAGFHILGQHPDMDTRTNRNAVAISPHTFSEIIRRQSYIEKVATGLQPNRFRPLPAFPPANWETISQGRTIPTFRPAKIKELCLTAGSELSTGIPCGDAGTVCRVNAANARLGLQYGECTYRDVNQVFAGLSCREGRINNGISVSAASNSQLPFNFFTFRDQFLGMNQEEMPSEIYNFSDGKRCGRPFGGIPLGRVADGCDKDTASGRLEWVDAFINTPAVPNSQLNLPNRMCALRGGDQFDRCAATDHFIQCLSQSEVRRTPIDLCYEGRFCREDYLCQQLPVEIVLQYTDANTRAAVERRVSELNRRNIGFCVPNYFVLNMRIDGHPLPETRH